MESLQRLIDKLQIAIEDNKRRQDHYIAKGSRTNVILWQGYHLLYLEECDPDENYEATKIKFDTKIKMLQDSLEKTNRKIALLQKEELELSDDKYILEGEKYNYHNNNFIMKFFKSIGGRILDFLSS